MKKLSVLLLALSLCVALVSCGQSTLDVPDPQEVNAIFDDRGSNITCLIRISINPEFELIVDDQGTVCDVIRLNDDAEQVFARATNVVMKPYDEAVAELLAAAQNSGYLTDKSTVSVTVILREDCAFGDAVISETNETVQEFVDAKQCSMEVWDGREISDPTRNDEGNDIEGGTQETNGEEVRDANGKLVSRTTEYPTPEGILTITEYFDANENKSKEVQERNGNTSIAEYDASGRRSSFVEEFTNPAGVRETRKTTYTYDENGNVAAEHTDISDGSHTEIYYYADGSMGRQYYRKANGSYWDNYYDRDGNLTDQDSKEYNDLGGWSEWIDYPDGSREEYYHAPDGTVWFNWFDANGNQLGQKRVQ